MLQQCFIGKSYKSNISTIGVLCNTTTSSSTSILKFIYNNLTYFYAGDITAFKI